MFVSSVTASLPLSEIDHPVTIRKMEKHSSKKSFANRLSKPFSSLKFSVPKSLQSHSSTQESSSAMTNHPSNVPFSSKSSVSKKSIDSSPLTSSSKKLQTDLDYLRDQLNQKELLIVELTRTSVEERVKFERDTRQLHHVIEQLQEENRRLKQQQHSQ